MSRILTLTEQHALQSRDLRLDRMANGNLQNDGPKQSPGLLIAEHPVNGYRPKEKIMASLLGGGGNSVTHGANGQGIIGNPT